MDDEPGHRHVRPSIIGWMARAHGLPEGPIVGLWAHPDDESYCMGGLMAAAADAGERVTIVCATRGEAGSQDHERWPPDEMAQVREAELRDASAVLGVDDVRFLDYVDGACQSVPDAEAVAKIEDILREIQPRLVITFDELGGTGHPDHVCINRWARRAFERSAPAGARLVYMAETTEWVDRWKAEFDRYNVFAPGTPKVVSPDEVEISFELTDQLLDRKIAALRAHVSQTNLVFEMFGEQMIRDSHRVETFALAAKK